MSTTKSNIPDSKLNPFADLSALRLDQSYAGSVGVKKLVTAVPVRKPSKQDFVRVHPGENYRHSPAALLELKEERETYFVTPRVAPALVGEWRPASLFTGITRQGTVFVWPCWLPGEDGKVNEWHRSLAEAAEIAMDKWVRVSANMNAGAYDVFAAIGELPDPVWPEESFEDILGVAFRQRFIDSEEHEVISKLRGAA
jgi:hypothetical protein